MLKIVRPLLSVAIAGLLLAGCSGSAPPPPTPQPQAATSTHRIKTPFDGLLKDRAKAKAVQKKMDANARKQEQALQKIQQAN